MFYHIKFILFISSEVNSKTNYLDALTAAKIAFWPASVHNAMHFAQLKQLAKRLLELYFTVVVTRGFFAAYAKKFASKRVSKVVLSKISLYLDVSKNISELIDLFLSVEIIL